MLFRLIQLRLGSSIFGSHFDRCGASARPVSPSRVASPPPCCFQRLTEKRYSIGRSKLASRWNAMQPVCETGWIRNTTRPRWSFLWTVKSVARLKWQLACRNCIPTPVPHRPLEVTGVIVVMAPVRTPNQRHEQQETILMAPRRAVNQRLIGRKIRAVISQVVGKCNCLPVLRRPRAEPCAANKPGASLGNSVRKSIYAPAVGSDLLIGPRRDCISPLIGRLAIRKRRQASASFKSACFIVLTVYRALAGLCV